MPPKVYLTTTLPYVNADPHIGFASEIVAADVFARGNRRRGREVFFNTGTDEHGMKIYRRALDEKLAPQAYADIYAAKFLCLKTALNLSYDYFSRTTDSRHVAAAQEFWRRCAKAGDIYRKSYRVRYCVGCELEKTDSELKDGRCPIHPNQELEIIEEENYFFRFSKYQKPLLDLYAGSPDFVIPAARLNEIRTFVERGLRDFSISRTASKMPWGVPVPDDESQVMFVWFDALVNYVSAVGWPSDLEQFEKWWPAVQLAGKDNLRQQAAMWQAMLLSAGLRPSRQIVIHGFVTSGGQKMSKSTGNVINPLELVEDYGTDAVRYFLARHVQPFEDTDVTLDKFKEVYNANLANGLGNLVSRVMTLASTHLARVTLAKLGKGNPPDPPVSIAEHFDRYELKQAADVIWRRISELDMVIQRDEPFKTVKIDLTKGKRQITVLVEGLAEAASWLAPFMPQTSQTILNLIADNQMPVQPLFPRK